MSTIDHLVSFPSEAEALASPLMARWVTDGAWNTSTCFPGLTLVVSIAVNDEEGNELSPQENFPGFWLLISTQGEAPDVELAGAEPCRMVAHRERALAGEAFIFGGESLRADPAQIAAIARIDGLPAGSAYPIQAPLVIP